MAKELSQEEVLDFLCQGGGKVPNTSLLAHFKHFLRDPRAADDQQLKRRERFKRYVNSVAVVKQEGAVKYVVLRSRYRDLLGEDLTPADPGEVRSQDEPALSNNRHGDEMGSNLLHGFQVGGGWSSQTEANGDAYHRGEPALFDLYRQHDPEITLIDPYWIDNINETANGKVLRENSYTEGYSHEPDIRLQQPSSQSPSSSAYTYVPRDLESTSSLSKTSSPVNNTHLWNRNTFPHDDNEVLLRTFSQQPIDDTCIPSTNIPSSPSHTCIPISKTSSAPSNTSIPISKTSSARSNTSILLSKTSSSPSSTSIPISKTSSSPSNTSIPIRKTSCSPSNTSIPISKTSSSPSNTSIPITKTTSSPSNTFTSFNKTSSSPSNASTKTSEPPSNTSSPYSKDYYPSVPYSKDSSFCSTSEMPSLPQPPTLDAIEHWRPPSGGDHKAAACNPAFVSVNCRGQQEQNVGCSEILAPNFEMNSTFPQEVHSEQEVHFNHAKDQQIDVFYQEQTVSSPSRYTNSSNPFSPLLLPLESRTVPIEGQLEFYQPASPCPSPPLPFNNMHEMWISQMPIFKSIRCQLSLQDMEDFVDQESCGSEGSDSGEGGDCDTEHKDDDFSSDSNTEKYTQYIEQKCENTRRCPPNRKFLSIIEQYNQLQSGDMLGAKDTLVECGTESTMPADTRKSPYIAKSFLTDQAPILFELARHPPKHRASSRFQELMSSSDDELIDRDFRRRRRPSRTKRPTNIVLVAPQPDMDLLLATKPVSDNEFIVNHFADQKDYQAQCITKTNVDFLFKKSFSYKSSVIPLDPTEHDWIVKSASASWLQVYGLFSQDPQLALRKDFISGYTALHWFAKHGAIEMFHKLVAGAKKARIELDFNIKSNGGYTPLHIAAIHGHHKVAALLVEKLKVNVKLRDNSGKRAWQYLNCHTSGEVWQLLGAPKGKTIFASRTLNTTYHLNTQNKSSQINRKTSLAAFLKPQHQKWKSNNHPVLREREIYSD